MSIAPPAGVHEMIEHLIAAPEDRALVKRDLDLLCDRFGIDAQAREVLRRGGRDDLAALGIHGNLVVKWLIWSARPTMPFFPIGYYFDRRP
jgi:hypothetical protein